VKKAITKSRLLFRVMLNVLFVIIEVILIVSLTRSWFINNKNVDTAPIDFHTTHIGMPLYLSAVFNNNTPPPNYANEAIIIDKYAIPGDIMELSVFIDLQYTSYKNISVTTSGMPEWLTYVDNTAKIAYAQKEYGPSEHLIAITIDELTPIQAEIFDVVKTDDTLIFKISLFNDFYVHGDCIALNFKIHFVDEGINQNSYIGQVINIGFKAQEIF